MCAVMHELKVKRGVLREGGLLFICLVSWKLVGACDRIRVKIEWRILISLIWKG